MRFEEKKKFYIRLWQYFNSHSNKANLACTLILKVITKEYMAWGLFTELLIIHALLSVVFQHWYFCLIFFMHLVHLPIALFIGMIKEIKYEYEFTR